MIHKISVLTVLLLCAPQLAFSAQKTDIVFLTNGDRVTGEVIRLEAGVLEFKTDTMGTTFIEWRFIADIISEKNHSLETVGGIRLLGQLEKPEKGDYIQVQTPAGRVTLDSDEVVSVWPVEASFLDRMDLETSVGFDYAKSTDITNFILSANFRLRGVDRLTEASLRTDVTTSGESNDQHRYEVRAGHQYLLPEGKFRAWLAGFDRNDALGLDARLTGGAAMGKYFVKTNSKWFSLSAGLLASEERPKEGDREVNVEALASMRYRYFRFADPERNFDTTLSVFPSVTDFGRVRWDLRSTFKLEFLRDLFWSMELYASYDSDPLSQEGEKSDYGIISSLGWTY